MTEEQILLNTIAEAMRSNEQDMLELNTEEWTIVEDALAFYIDAKEDTF